MSRNHIYVKSCALHNSMACGYAAAGDQRQSAAEKKAYTLPRTPLTVEGGVPAKLF